MQYSFSPSSSKQFFFVFNFTNFLSIFFSPPLVRSFHFPVQPFITLAFDSLISFVFAVWFSYQFVICVRLFFSSCRLISFIATRYPRFRYRASRSTFTISERGKRQRHCDEFGVCGESDRNYGSEHPVKQQQSQREVGAGKGHQRSGC